MKDTTGKNEKLANDLQSIDKHYEHRSHTHCWNQKSPACGQAIEKHTQCCLCDLKVPTDTTKELSKCCGSSKFNRDSGATCYKCGKPFLPASNTGEKHIHSFIDHSKCSCGMSCDCDTYFVAPIGSNTEEEKEECILCKINHTHNCCYTISPTSEQQEREEVPSEDWKEMFGRLCNNFGAYGRFDNKEHRKIVKDFIRQTRQEAVEEYKVSILKQIRNAVPNSREEMDFQQRLLNNLSRQ